MADANIEIIGLAGIQAFFKGMEDFVINGVPEILKILAFDAESLIKDRTSEKGTDVNDIPFLPYSEKYLERKKKRGGKNFVPGLVNLVDEGRMFGAIHSRLLSKSQALVAVLGEPRVYGLAHQIGTRGKKREWFGLTEADRRFLQDEFMTLASERLAQK